MNVLYVYDLENENIERLLVHGDRFADNSMEIVTLYYSPNKSVAA